MHLKTMTLISNLPFLRFFYHRLRIICWCGLLLMVFMQPRWAYAESIIAVRSEARILNDGRLAISSRFKTDLPEQLQDALKQGVPLDFALSWRLEKPTLTSYRSKISQWVGNDDSVNYRLSFHPLTNRYRVSVGTFSSEYRSLEVALKGVGAIANWSVLHADALSDVDPKEVKAQVRLNLSTSKLPKPFQINSLTSNNWQLDSGWHDLEISK